VAHDLSWQYGYEKVPKGLTNSYAYAELAGAQGPVVSHDIILGVVLFAPGCTYPAHAHKGITESYVCLSGAVSENHQGVYVPGSMIFNPPEHLHFWPMRGWAILPICTSRKWSLPAPVNNAQDGAGVA